MTVDYLVSTDLPDRLGVSAIVLAANYHSPFECLDDISKELVRQSVKGAVAFDLLLSSGSKANRYFLAQFDGRDFAVNSICKFNGECQDLSKVSAEVLRRSVGVIDAILLSPAMRFAVVRGIPL